MINHPELNINFDPREVMNHSCPDIAYDGMTGHMSVAEAYIIASTISQSIQPLVKWMAVKHAIERRDTVDELCRQFPWLDLYDDEDDTDETDESDVDEDDIDESDDDENVEDENVENDKNDDVENDLMYDPPPEDHTVDIPKEITDTIHQTWGLSPEQVDTIMQLISLPENGTTKWPLFYNYIEYGDDHALRGYTTTIFGATTGTGSLLEVFKELRDIDPDHPLVVTYMDAMEHAKGGDISGLEGLAHVNGDPTKAKAKYSNWTPLGRTHLDHIEGDLARLDVDDRWRRAVWRAFLRLNWESAAHFCNKTGPCESRPGPLITTPLGKGFIVDTSLNHGDCRWWNEAETWTAIWDAMVTHPTSEKHWLKQFMKARKQVLKSGFQGLDWSKTGDRVNLWRELLRDDNMQLERPIHVVESSHAPPIWPDNIVIQ